MSTKPSSPKSSAPAKSDPAPPKPLVASKPGKSKVATPPRTKAKSPQRAEPAAAAPRASGLAAAHQVLRESKQPMRVRDITSTSMSKGLWKPEGKTPWATLAAAIGREIKDKGKLSRFKKAERGLFAAAATKA